MRRLMEPIAANAVEVWYLPIEDLAHHPWAQYSDLLSKEERDQASRFVRRGDRCHYIAAHALLRAALSNFGGLPPAAWRFRLQQHGRPEIESGLSVLPLRFSLSHTDGLVAAAVTTTRDVGLDVEAMGRPILDMTSVTRFFASDEVSYLNSCAPGRRPQAFFEIWTMKEAFVKATGFGLSLPLDQFAVGLDPYRLLYAPPNWDRPDQWHYRCIHPTPRHQMSVVARAASDTSSLCFTLSRTAADTLTPCTTCSSY